MQKINLDNTGLVIEGGGMRGVFTCGVLDAFMDYGLWLNYVVAVSAGAGNAASYLSRQPRRARCSNIELLKKYNFVGMKCLLTKGTIFDMDLLYDRFPNDIYPYDYDTYQRNPAVFEIVTTNCLTGRAEYLQERNSHPRLLSMLRASGSLPYVSPIVNVDGKPMLDGGLADSIPIDRAMQTGHPFNIVILTRNKGFRKTDNGRKIPPFIYSKYPRLRLLLSTRAARYNAQLERIERLEEQGQLVCLRPEKPIEVDRIEKNIQKLERLYQEGYQIGERFLMKKFKELQGVQEVR